MNRTSVIAGWTRSILAGRWNNITTFGAARAHAERAAEALPGLFRTDVIELEAA